jgi:diguanylate cyclase (GGDEF)-like protein
MAAAAAVVLVGSIGSVLGAMTLARNDAQQSRQAQVDSSQQIASTLELALQHEQDLAISLGTFFSENTDATQAQFAAWVERQQAFQRYPELQGLAKISVVPAAGLQALAAEEAADPPGTPGSSALDIVPAGSRPSYCLATASEPRNPALAVSAGIDYCATSLGPKLLAAEDSGQGAYLPYTGPGGKQMVIGVPIYGGTTTPTTVAGRRADFVGWTGTQIKPAILLNRARAGHQSIGVEFVYGTGASAASFTGGPTSHMVTTVNLHNGWHVRTFATATAAGPGILDNNNSLVLLLAGLAFSFLLGSLVYVLGTSRSRALELVEERTEQLRHQAFHDPLTGLPNRALIIDRIDQMQARSRRDGTTSAALFLDLDNFKDINDTLGHSAGDRLLVDVGNRIRATLREGDSVGRLGGDEFVVLVESPPLVGGAEQMADRILDSLTAPFDLEGSDAPLEVTASIGIASSNTVTPNELLRDADIALYRAKASGKHRAVVFSASMQEALEERRNLQLDLSRALESREFFLLYQPTVDLSTGALNGVEALLRWRHPVRGVLQPDSFIPALESSGLIVPVGQWVVEEACRQGAAWQRLGHRFTISVNVSAEQLERDRIVDTVYGALKASEFDASLLLLELTETALMQDVHASIERLDLLKALGVRVAIDDFGTGYSSMAYLQQFPIDVLKIDRSFVSRIGETAESAALVHTLVQLAKVLGMETIAEGIEDDEQRRRLRAEGVESGQGFLFSRPVDAATIDQLLRGTAPVGTPLLAR